ncbi:MAG TPA: AAA family ATPase, partial [Gammaproteobacteria bacterium]|nr:AAA family ATPase [Gammaproteobacteria bacterium]
MPTQSEVDTEGGISLATQGLMIQSLRSMPVFGLPAGAIEVHETHISWVILAGDYAYKVKKAVNFGFLDFSTLRKRHFFCQEELRLNRRFAPQLYLEVTAITGSVTQPLFNGHGEPFEFAVKMRRFPQECLLVELAARQQLLPEHIDELAILLAGLHDTVDRAGEGSEFGRAEGIQHWVMENFSRIRTALQHESVHPALDDLEHWCRQVFEVVRADLERRRKNGFIRECHGDLHLGNLALVDGCITPFDCIEFNPQLRWIDVMSEVVFLVMDLLDRGYASLAYRFLNGYLRQTGDYAGVCVLRYYMVYRALVRAKVSALCLAQSTMQTDDRAKARRNFDGYISLAADWAATPSPFMLIMHGVSGSGKSWLAGQLVERLGAIQLRSDIERKRLYGYRANDTTGSGVQAGIYSRAATERAYAHLAALAGSVLAGGLPVIVDAAFLRESERERFQQLAASLGVPFGILHVQADEATLMKRIERRQQAGTDPSEAGVDVLELQLATQEPLLPSET